MTAIASTPATGGEPSLSEESVQSALRPPSAKVIEENPSLGNSGTISPRGQKAIAAVDRELQQQREPPGETLSAVQDLGLDPEGNTPIDAALEQAISTLSNTRVQFPSDATFRVTSGMVLSPAGPIDLVGNGTTFRVDENIVDFTFNFADLPSGSLVQGFNINMSAQGARTGVRAETDGAVEFRDITIEGYASPTPSEMDAPNILVPIASSQGATFRITNFVAVGGSAAGMHSDPDKPESAPENRLGTPIGLWVGQSTTGTVQLVNPRLRGWSNGTYSGRTKGRVEIIGGVLWNNINTQVRISGGSICDGSTLILDDRQWDMNENPGPYTLGGNQGVHAVRVDPGGNKGNQTDPVVLRNVEIQGKSMETLAGLIDFEGSAGPGRIQNCRITNHIDVPAVLGERPGSQGSYGAAPQTNIEMDQCMVQGQSPAPALEANGRPDSRVRRTCITIPNAGPEDIVGAQIGEAVSFGQCTQQSGLRAPREVGSNVNVSSLPAPNVSFNGTGLGASVSRGPSREEFRSQQRRKAMGAISALFAVAAGFALVLLIVFFFGRKVLKG